MDEQRNPGVADIREPDSLLYLDGTDAAPDLRDTDRRYYNHPTGLRHITTARLGGWIVVGLAMLGFALLLAWGF